MHQPIKGDKLVQGDAAEVLNEIYEEDFLGFSYGFRPGRGPHNALGCTGVYRCTGDSPRGVFPRGVFPGCVS